MGAIEERLIDHMALTPYDLLPDAVVDAAKAQLLDSLAVGYAGRHADGVAPIIALSEEWGGAPQASILATDKWAPAPVAAQINATMIHALDFDDGHGGALMHPGVIVTATMFAIGQRQGGLSGRELLAVTATGTDVLCRLGKALEVSTNRAVTGWHFTSIFGALVSAAMAGRVLGLDRASLGSAVGIAYHQASSNMQSVIDGSLTKRLGPGFAVRNGIVAALLAERGVTGTPNWLTGRNGLANQYFHGSFDEERLFAELGRTFEGPQVAIKRYPCCGITHPFIDAALDIKSRLSAGDKIERIRLVRGTGADYVFEPQEIKLRPRNVVDAQFSAPWGAAAALLHGRAEPESYMDRAIVDPAMLQMTGLMEIETDPRFSRSDGIEAGQVEVLLRGGRILTAEDQGRMNGEGERLTLSAAEAKLRLCMQANDAVADAATEEIAEAFRTLDQANDGTAVIQLFGRLAS